jgi:ABC-type uncharacterized transport system substrate-binding protein
VRRKIFGILDFGFSISRRETLLATLLLPYALLLALCGIVEAQQGARVPRVGVITTGSPEALAHLLNGFKEGLRENGYQDGQNIRVEVRYAEGKAERLPLFANELVRAKVDVIVCDS